MKINIVLNHFEIWLIQFEEKEKKICSISDRFVFKRVEQALPYPKKIIDNLIENNNNS